MAYNGCKIKNYSRINPYSGAGFILKRLNDLNTIGGVTKRAVYEGTDRYTYWTPGYHSSIWAKLLEDGLIAPWDGFMDVMLPDSYWHSISRTGIRAKGEGCGKNYTVKYFITKLGRDVLDKMNARFAAIKKAKQEFCKRNGIEFGTGKTLPTIKEFDEVVGPVGLLTVAEKIDSVIRELQEIRDSL